MKLGHKEMKVIWQNVSCVTPAAALLAASMVKVNVVPAALPQQPNACPWDLDANGLVGITDFLDLLAAWGPNPGHPADFDGDGEVGINDFLDLLAAWGPCP